MEFLYSLLSQRGREWNGVGGQFQCRLALSGDDYRPSSIVLARRHCCTLRASLYEHDVGQGVEKMGHTHDSWQGNIALGLRAIARGGRFGGVNNCAYRGSHQGYMGLQFASGADFAKSIKVWGVGL